MNKHVERLMKRVLSLFIAASMLISGFGMIAFSNPSYAASKVRLSRKTVTVKAGKKTKIQLKNTRRKVTWKSSNKKIVKIVRTKGKRRNTVTIKGVKKGKAYIIAKVGKKKYKCKVTVTKASSKPAVIEPAKPQEPEEREIEIRDLSISSVDQTAGMTVSAPVIKEPDEAFISAYADFSIGLLQKTIDADQERTGNTLISPESITTALAMTANGAAGQTLAEMEEVLGQGMSVEDYNKYLSGLNKRLISQDQCIYQLSNSIWAKDGAVDPRDDFLRTNKSYYDSEFYLAPFDEQTVTDINNWVYNKTRNMIEKIIQELSKDARMVLINTIAFEGKWEEPFEKKYSKTEDFNAFDGSKQSVTMMTDSNSYRYFELMRGQGFVKKYKGGQIAFAGILPPEGMDANEFVSQMSGESFIDAVNGSKYKQIRLTLPRFAYDYGTEMSEALQEMGIVSAFTDGADFSRMADPTPDTPGLEISEVIHKTHIELDENGTKAAAATAVVMEKNTSIIGDSMELKFDRPFVYALIDTQTGLPLFIGTVRTIN